MQDEAEKSKIIVDEDWKAQVEADKEKSRRATDKPATTQSATSSSSAEPSEEHLPPASLPFLLTTLATQTMIALGQIPNPITGKIDLRLLQAKHYIDTLGMLEQKTTGNRTAEESALLDELLHQLRMAYVMMQTSATPSAGQPAVQ